MKLHTFTADTMAQALTRVKSELGPDAVIVHTRSYTHRYCLGLRRREVVEITAGRPGGRRQPAAPAPAPPAAGPPRPGALLQTPAGQGALVLGLSREVGELRDLVGQLVRETRAGRTPDIPPDLFDHYTRLISQQVEQELAARLVRDLRASLRTEHLADEAFVRQRLARQLERLLPTSGPIVRTKKTGPHIVALVGPTGVGKTTTIAKLAAHLKLREGRRVALVTIDTYRIAAVDQLRKYADILGTPLRVVTSPEDLATAVAALADAEFILIDTAGRSPADALKLSELKGFLTAARPDEVHLVLSSTASQACIEKAVECFGKVGVDRVIFTKLDEAVQLGVVLNVVHKLDKAVSYITTGQDVPDDIEVGQGGRLARLILGETPTTVTADATAGRPR